MPPPHTTKHHQVSLVRDESPLFGKLHEGDRVVRVGVTHQRKEWTTETLDYDYEKIAKVGVDVPRLHCGYMKE
jgi:hypothetical protein